MNTDTFKFDNPLIDKYNASIDSLRVTFPLGQVELLDPLLKETIIRTDAFESTGEIVRSEKLKTNKVEHHFLDKEGRTTNTFYAWTDNKGQGFEKGKSGKTLQITLSSKMIGELYFNGLKGEFLELLYDKIMGLKLFYISFEAFKKGRVHDIDVKFDFTMEEILYKLFTQHLYTIAKSTVKQGGVMLFKGNNNIQFQSRSYSPNNRRYLKLYDKALEGSEVSATFFNHFFECL